MMKRLFLFFISFLFLFSVAQAEGLDSGGISISSAGADGEVSDPNAVYIDGSRDMTGTLNIIDGAGITVESGSIGAGTSSPTEKIHVAGGNIRVVGALESETLSETDFATHVNWATVGDFDDTGGNATYTHSTGVGAITQAQGYFVIPAVPSKRYEFTYTISDAVGIKSALVTNAFADQAYDIDLTNGTHTTLIKSAGSPGNFVITADSLPASISEVVFSGGGLDDATSGGVYLGDEDLIYVVEIDGEGTPDTFKWSDDGGSTWDAETVAITGSAQTLNNGVTIAFVATTGHTETNFWTIATIVDGAFVIDDVSVRQALGGDVILESGGMLTGGGATGLTVIPDGWVGINKTDPGAKLEIYDSLLSDFNLSTASNGTSVIRFSEVSGLHGANLLIDGATNYFKIQRRAYDLDYDILTMNYLTGNIGIRRPTPDVPLDVGGAIRSYGIGSRLTLWNGTASSKWDLVNGFASDTDGKFTIFDKTHNASRILIDTAGYIGIDGVTSPTAAIDLPDSTTARASQRIRNGVAPTAPNIGDLWSETAENGALYYQRNATEKVNLANQPEHIIYVNTISDLPPPVAGEHILVANTIYDFNLHTITSSSRLVLNGVADSFLVNGNFIYTGPGAAIKLIAQSPNARQIINFSAQATDVAGEIFDISATGAGIGAPFILNLFSVYPIDGVNPGANSIGTVSGVTFVSRIVQLLYVGGGLTLSDVLGGINVGELQIDFYPGATGTFLTITGTTSGSVQISGYTSIIDTGQKGIFIDPATTYLGSITFSGSTQTYEGTATKDDIFESGSLDNTSVGAKFTGNVNIPNSTVSGQAIALPVTPIVTDLPVANAQVILNLGTNFVWNNLERGEGSTTGVFTYDGLEDTLLLVDGNVEVSAGTNQDLRVRYAKILACTPRVVTFNPTTDQILETATPRANNDRISFLNTPGTLPTGLRKDVIYYVIAKTTDNFQVSYTLGGPAAVSYTHLTLPTILLV